MKIISREYCAAQDLYIFKYICDSAAEIANLPTEEIAYGSSAVCGDGKLYFFFPDGEWKAMEQVEEVER